MTRQLVQRLARGALVAFAVWTALALLFAGQLYASSAMRGQPVTWPRALAYAFADWYVFGILAPPVAWVGRNVRLEWPLRPRCILVHLTACAAFVLAYLVLRPLVALWMERIAGREVPFLFLFQTALVTTLPQSLLVYWAVVATQQIVAYQERVRDRERRATALEKRLTEARLQALQMQLNPHFLFNTLNAISSLMHQDVEKADRMLVRLSELLRRALDTTDRQEVPLGEELAFLDRYLEIEQARFGARLVVRRFVDGGLLNALVPNLLLQPLVENAIKHGIERQRRPGVIEVDARRHGADVVLIVRDNGPGLVQKASAPHGHGIGLSNTRRRLEQLYGQRQTLQMRDADGGGTEVVVRLPWRL